MEGSDFWVTFKKDIYRKELLVESGLNDRQLDALLHFKQKGEIVSSAYVKRYNIAERTARFGGISRENLLPKTGEKKSAEYLFR